MIVVAKFFFLRPSTEYSYRYYVCCCVGGALISGDDRCSGRQGLMSIMILCGQDTGRQWYAGGEGGGSPGFAIVDGMGGVAKAQVLRHQCCCYHCTVLIRDTSLPLSCE